MSPRGILLLVLSAVLTAAGNLLWRGSLLQHGTLSLAADRVKDQLLSLGTQPTFMVGAVFYVLAVLIWLVVLSTENLSTAFPVQVGLTFVLVAIGAAYFFNEAFPGQKIFGMLLILAGIVSIARA